MHVFMAEWMLSVRLHGMQLCVVGSDKFDYHVQPRQHNQPVQVGVHAPADPVLAAWKGGSRLAASPVYRQRAVTKLQYAEYGAANLIHRQLQRQVC